MASRRIIEGTWKCGSCGTEGILARYKSCPTCGNPRESDAESKFDFGSASASGGLERATVTDAGALQLAAAGADWFCGYCGASNRGDHPACRTCGALRADAAAAVRPPAPPRRRRYIFLKVVAVLVAAVFALGYWAAQTKDFEATIKSVSWERNVTLQTFTQVGRRGWRDQLTESATAMPVNGIGEFIGTENIRDCEDKQRGTVQVAIGTERVCRQASRSVACGSHTSCSTRDLGNGYAEEVCQDVTDYCSESYEDCNDETQYRTDPVFVQECAYDTWEWQGRNMQTVRDDEAPPAWPVLAIEENERTVLGQKFDAVLEYQRKGTHIVKFHATEPAAYEQWRRGQKRVIVVTNGGVVKGIRDGAAVLPIEP